MTDRHSKHRCCQRLGTLLQHKDHPLAFLVTRARAQQRLLEAVRACVPRAVKEHCLGAVVADRTLRLYVDSPAWSTQLRYRQRDLIEQLNEREQLDIHSVRVRVSPRLSVIDQRPSRARLSAAGAESIRASAKALGDSRLRDALMRLAAQSQDPSSDLV